MEFQNVSYSSRKHTTTAIHHRITSLLIFFCFLCCYFYLFTSVATVAFVVLIASGVWSETQHSNKNFTPRNFPLNDINGFSTGTRKNGNLIFNSVYLFLSFSSFALFSFSYHRTRNLEKGRSNVYCRSHNIRHMLAAVSHVLRVCLSQTTHHIEKLCAASVPWILLAGDVQQHGQSDHLLLDESPISTLFSENHVLLLFSLVAEKRIIQGRDGLLAKFTFAFHWAQIEIM